MAIPIGIASKKFVKPEKWAFTKDWHCEAEPNATAFAKSSLQKAFQKKEGDNYQSMDESSVPEVSQKLDDEEE